jgi:hypothetical protein
MLVRAHAMLDSMGMGFTAHVSIEFLFDMCFIFLVYTDLQSPLQAVCHAVPMQQQNIAQWDRNRTHLPAHAMLVMLAMGEHVQVL